MKKILTLLCISAALLSCTDDDINPEQVFTSGPKVVGFANAFQTVSYFVDEGDVQVDFPVNLSGNGDGTTLASDIVIDYEVDAASSTATEGTEFDFVTTTGQLTLKAGNTFVGFPLIVHTGSLNPTMRTELIIKLKSASNNTVVDSKYTNFRVVFVGCQSLIAGNYTSTVTRVSPAATIVRPVDNVTMTSVNNFETMQSGIWSPGTLAASGEGYDLVDICGEITISEQNLAGIYSNLLRGLVTNNGTDGSVISATQFETTYEIGFTGNTVWREYRSTYTRN
jgi:hypothetical protein